MTAEELRKWMYDHYWTPTELARRLGVTRDTIARYRTGKRPIPQEFTDRLKDLERA